MRADLLAHVDRFQHAVPGSSDAVLARKLGVRGDGGDAARLDASLERIAGASEALIELLHSPTGWSNGDFAVAGFHVAAELGFPQPSAGTAAELAIGDGNDTVATRRWIDVHRAGVARAADGIGNVFGAEAFGIYADIALAIHHEALEIRENLVALGRTLGL
jgi:hypothetical protein